MGCLLWDDSNILVANGMQMSLIMSPLLSLARTGSRFAMLFMLLTTSACGHQDEGVTPLMRAAVEGDPDTVGRLIESGADVDAESRYAWTAAMFAAREGHTDVVEVLLQAGATPDQVSESVPPGPLATRGGYYPTTAMAEALRHGHFETAALLLNHVSVVHPLDLVAAAELDTLEWLRALVEQGGDPAATTALSFHGSPLCAASAAGRLDTVQWLIAEQGVEVDQRSGGTNALEQAVRNDHVATVEFLLDRGADPNATFSDSTMPTILLVAIKKPQSDSSLDNNVRIVKALMDFGADARLKPEYSVLGLGIFGEGRNAIEVAQAKVEEYQGYYDEETDAAWRAQKLDRLNHRLKILELLKDGE